MESVYLSRTARHAKLVNKADLVRLVEEGLIEESHYMDAKRSLEPGKAKNKEHARDLASFAVDGGTLLVGVDEDKETGTFVLAPQPLRGLRERIETVALLIPDPPLAIIVKAIPDDIDLESGYLIIHIPPSAVAPHMVDGKYLGRGDAQKRYLSDTEVLRLHGIRQARENDAANMLNREMDRNPVVGSGFARRQAHLHLVAEPVTAREEMLLNYLDMNRLRQLIVDGAYSDPVVSAIGRRGFSPDYDAATRYSRRIDGAAFSTYNVDSSRGFSADAGGTGRNEEDMLDIEFSEDGAIRIVMTRLSDSIDSEQVLFDTAVVIYVRRLLGLIGMIAALVGYFGSWRIGIGATGIRSLVSYEATQQHHGSLQALEEDVYKRLAVASFAEVAHTPGAVSQRLVGRFLRKLGTQASFAKTLTDPAPADLSEEDES